MRLLDETVAIDLQGDVIHPRRRAAIEWGIDQWLEDLPDFRPDIAKRLAERPGVLRAEHRAVRIVVDRDVVRPPPQQQRDAIRQQKTDDHPQGGGPRLGRAEWGLRPVVRAHERRHLAAANEPVGGG